MFLQLTLTDELVECPRPETGLDRLLDVGGEAGIAELVTHGGLRVPSVRRAAVPPRHLSGVSSRSVSRISASP